MPIDAPMPQPEPPAVCRPPPGFQDTPHPQIAAAEKLVARVEEIEIPRPLAHVLASVENVPLEKMIEQGGDLPKVFGTHNLTPGPFDAPGSRRLACLTDGSTLVEQVLEKTRTPTSYRFRYVVWNYTTKAARPIRYGLGEFVYTAVAEDRTHIRWTYAFELRRDRFPGALGPFGNWLLRVAFLDRSYAKMMQGTLARTKALAER
jgi:polyketide cyclase/dehydrase/lipid transport protein